MYRNLLTCELARHLDLDNLLLGPPQQLSSVIDVCSLESVDCSTDRLCNRFYEWLANTTLCTMCRVYLIASKLRIDPGPVNMSDFVLTNKNAKPDATNNCTETQVWTYLAVGQ